MDSAQRSLSSLDKRASKVGSTFRRIAGAAVFAGAGTALTNFAKSAVSAASEAQQSLGATRSIFEQFSGAVIKESKKAADGVGLSANSYREYSNVLGALFKNQGVALKDLSGETSKHLKLAADLSAMYGGPVSDSVEALTAAYKGEFNQLEKYGVSLKQATINTEAEVIAKKQYGKALKDLTPAQEAVSKQLATQELLFRQTADAQGTFKKEANTLAGQQQRLKAELENVTAEIGTALLPIMTDLAKWARDDLVPALEDFASWLKDNRSEIRDFGRALADTVLPALKTLAELVIGAVKAFAALPGPIKSVIFQVGLAALAFPRLTAAMKLAQVQGAAFVGTMKNSASRTAALGGIARNVAGIGGLALLTSAATDGESSLSSWAKSIGGGAAAGAALGSVIPGVGTAVGALGGAAVGAAVELWQFNDAQRAAERAAADAKTTTEGYAATLDQLSGAATRATRELILHRAEQQGVLPLLNQLDVNTKDLIGSVLGQEDATRRLNRAVRENISNLSGDEQATFNTWLRRNTQALGAQRNEVIENSRDLATWKEALRGLPKEVQTEIKQLGAKATLDDIKKIARQYDLTPKELITRVEAAGINVVGRDLKELQNEIKKTGNTRPGTKWLEHFIGDVGKGKKIATDGSGDISNLLSQGINKASGKIPKAKGEFAGEIASLKSTASSGGQDIGANLGAGITSGIGGYINNAISAAQNLVRSAIAAARAEAEIQSPSRKMRRIGEQMGEGLDLGLRRSRRRVRRAGRTLIDAVMRSFIRVGNASDATTALDAAIDRMWERIRKRLQSVYDEPRQRAKALKQLKKALSDELKELEKYARKRDRLTAKLAKAQEKLRALQEQAKDYVQNVRDTFVALGNPTNIQSTNIDWILNRLRAQVSAAKEFMLVLTQLKSAGLNATTLDQLVQAGVENGLATAKAIASGGQAAIDEINALAKQLADTGTNIGQSVAQSLYGAGIEAAEGLVKGLQERMDELDRIARRIGRRIVRAIKEELNIASPSKVMQELGVFTVRGLAKGLENARELNRVEKAAARMTNAIGRGFEAPTLAFDAGASFSGGGGNTYQITVQAPVGSSEAQIGQTIVRYIDAYERQHGRRR